MTGGHRSDIAVWLDAIGLGQYVQAFADNDVDLDVAADLSDDDLRTLGLSLGHRRRFLKAAAALGGEPPQDAPVPGPPAREAEPQAGAERRQLTVMFCDLVGSTELSTRLDPEDLRDVIATYQQVCRDVVAGYDGYIARYMGDGILIYFGYPHAHEDDGLRAVHTGRDIIAGVRRLEPHPGLKLQVRIGVATGVVVVGDIIGEGASEESAVLGETPNVAARLQGLAAPNTMVISPRTRRLVDGAFILEDLGEHRLKGIEQPVRAWTVTGESTVRDRFARREAGRLIGRENELALILDRWQRAKRGEGQVVVLAGEAGIGKSRLVQALKGSIAADRPRIVHVACSSYHTQHPLYPFVTEAARLARFEDGETPDARLERIETFLADVGVDVAQTAPVIAALLSVPTDGRYPPHGLSAQALKQRTLDALCAILVARSHERPSLLVFDDAHWADPTSLELMETIVRAAQRNPILVVVTGRPEFQPPWRNAEHLTALNLQRLTPAQAEAVVAGTAGKPLPRDVVQTIVEKADGVPLFVEELTRNIAESDLLEDAGNAYRLSGPLPPLAIPTTLHDSLMARLDRLPSAKEVAQIGAAIGRQFNYDLIAAVTDLSDEKLQDALARLREAEIVYPEGDPPKASYLFKHALVQDAAYESLLRRRRQELHARIVGALESKFPDTADAEPGVLGRHCFEARLFPQAAHYYQKAGLIGALRSSMREALAQLEHGLQAAAQIEDAALRARIELDLRLTLVFPLRALKGLSAGEVERNYRRAFDLCRETQSPTQLLPVLYGLFAVVWARGDMRAAASRAEDLLAQARAADDPLSLVVAHYAMGIVAFFLGRNEDGVAHFDTVLAAYDPEKHAPLALTYAIEFGVGAWNFRAFCLSSMGRYREARACLDNAVALGRRLNHPFPLSHAMGVGAATFLNPREPEALLDFAEEAIALSREQGFAPYMAIAQLCRGWALVMTGKAEAGLEDLHDGIGLWVGVGYGLATPWFLAWHAEALVAAGKPAEALALLDDAAKRIEDGAQHQFLSRVKAVAGDALASRGDNAGAEAAYREALALAAAQNAHGERLHAAVRLAALLKPAGRLRDVAPDLGDVLGRLEGEDVAEVAAARALLAEQAAA